MYFLKLLLVWLKFFFFFKMIRPPPRSTLFPSTTLFRSRSYFSRRSGRDRVAPALLRWNTVEKVKHAFPLPVAVFLTSFHPGGTERQMSELIRRLDRRDRKSTRLNSSHLVISYAVFCLKK